MNNKEYKAIVKKAAKRFERLQELLLDDGNEVNWFIGEYFHKNKLQEFFTYRLMTNKETQIYFIRNKKKIPVMRVGNRVIKTNLTKRLDNLMNYLNKEETEKHNFIKKLETLNKEWKYKFGSDEETGVNKLFFKNDKGEYVAISSPSYYYGMINFQSYEVKIIHDDTVNESNLGKWKTKSYTIEQTTFNKRIDLTIEEIKDLLASIGRV